MPTINVSIFLRGEFENQECDRLVKQPTNRDDWLYVYPNQVDLKQRQTLHNLIWIFFLTGVYTKC